MSDARENPHADVAAYVLHALPAEEEAAFLEHLADCAACRAEATDLVAIAELLADVGERRLPDTVRRQVLERTAHTPQEAAPAVARDERTGPRETTTREDTSAALRPTALQRFGRPQLVCLAASLAAAVALGGTTLWQHQEADDARTANHQAAERSATLTDTLTAPDAALRTAKLTGGGTGGVLVSRTEGRAAFTSFGLPAPGKGRVHQLWFYDAGTYRPTSLLTGGGRQVQLLHGPLGTATAVCITIEPSGGSLQPTTSPLALIPLPR